jgi:YD repeat-containing protein
MSHRAGYAIVVLLVACADDRTECSVTEPVERTVPGPCTREVTYPLKDGGCFATVRWQYTYEGDRVVRAEKHNTEGISHQLTITYEYDEQGRLAVRETRSAGEHTDRYLERETYTYDELDRIVTIESDDQYGGQLESRSYDDVGRLLGRTFDRQRDGTLDEVHHYLRDDAGVMIARECDGCGRLLEGADGVIDLVCKREHLGESMIERCDGGRWPLDGVIDSAEHFQYDAHGNVLTRAYDGETWVFAERQANGIVEIEDRYTYDCWRN